MQRIGRHLLPSMRRTIGGFMQSGDFPIPKLYLKFGENTGSIVHDSSPESNNGTIDGATWTKGWLGPALLFDGEDDYAKVVNDASLQIVGDLTIIMRIYVNSLTGFIIPLCKHYNYEYEVYIRQTGDLMLQHGDGAYEFCTYSPAGAVTTGVWMNIGFTRDISEKKGYTYKDGVLIGGPITFAKTPTASTNDISIGARTFNSGWAPAIIDELLIFNVLLTAAQMRQQNYGIM